MSDRPTRASVTDVPCTCDYLQNAADDPADPIVFASEVNEYQFRYWDEEDSCPAMLIIFHCPFCGGAAPKSKRELLFARIPQDEEARLASLLTPLQSMAEAVEVLGAPDFDDYCVSRCFEQRGEPPETVYSREIRYHHLSTTVDVYVQERPDGKVFWTLSGKPLDNKGAGI